MSDSTSPVQWIKKNLSLVVMIILILALRWTVVEPFVVPTPSMEPTLKTGDRLYALKCAYDIRIPFTEYILFRTGSVHRGDVVLFRYPQNPEVTFVKRAVGLPGDKLELRDGVLFVNGQEITKVEQSNRDLLNDVQDKDRKTLFIEDLTGLNHWVIHHNDYARAPMRNLPEITVPPNSLFAMGDNRDNSHDSRAWGFVPMDNLKGKGIFIWFSAPAGKPEDYEGIMAIVNWFINMLKVWEWGDIRFERIGTLIQ